MQSKHNAHNEPCRKPLDRFRLNMMFVGHTVSSMFRLVWKPILRGAEVQTNLSILWEAALVGLCYISFETI
jgi:hypothetical protein